MQAEFGSQNASHFAKAPRDKAAILGRLCYSAK